MANIIRDITPGNPDAAQPTRQLFRNGETGCHPGSLYQ